MSLINYQHIHQQIKDQLFEISYKVECFNKTGDSDISRYAEIYFKSIFNLVFKNKGWHFEKAIKINQDTFDLIDNNNKVCIQITSNNRADKKNQTIKSFLKNNSERKLNQLIIFFISQKKPKANTENCDFIYEDYNVVELASLIEANCEHKQLLEIQDLLLDNFSFYKNVKQTENSTKRGISKREFNRCKKLQKELEKELVIPEFWKVIEQEKLQKYPYEKFKDSRFILRAIDDETYPNMNDNSKWSRTFMYDFYERGILIWLDNHFGTQVIINRNGDWRTIEYEEREKNFGEDFRKINVRILGKLPYRNIVSWEEGDNYYNDYHLHCEYVGVKKSPFEEIVYRYENALGFYWDDLDNEKRII